MLYYVHHSNSSLPLGNEIEKFFYFLFFIWTFYDNYVVSENQ